MLSTGAAGGTVDGAGYGSPQMTDEKTVILGSGMNRTLANLREDPHAGRVAASTVWGPEAPF